jgi:hypothetical protein
VSVWLGRNVLDWLGRCTSFCVGLLGLESVRVGLYISCTRGLLGLNLVSVWAVQVHGSVVGKNCSRFSGLRRSHSPTFLMYVGHLLFQLAWLSESHDTQWVCRGCLHWSVLWSSAQLPHLSADTVHSYVWWFHPWHLRHLIGSFFTFSVRIFLLHIIKPSAMILLADFASVKETNRWADFCSGVLLAVGLTQRILAKVSGSMWLASRISMRCASFSGSIVRGALKAIIV